MIEERAFGRIIEVNSGFLHSSDLNPDKPINWKRMVGGQWRVRLSRRPWPASLPHALPGGLVPEERPRRALEHHDRAPPTGMGGWCPARPGTTERSFARPPTSGDWRCLPPSPSRPSASPPARPRHLVLRGQGHEGLRPLVEHHPPPDRGAQLHARRRPGVAPDRHGLGGHLRRHYGRHLRVRLHGLHPADVGRLPSRTAPWSPDQPVRRLRDGRRRSPIPIGCSPPPSRARPNCTTEKL